MTVSLKHKFQSTLPDGVNPSLIRPSNWNDEHDLTLPENTIVGRVESGEGPAKALTQAEVIAFLGDDVGGIDSVEEDPAPKLGGDLDLNGHKIPGIDYDDLTNKPTLGTAAAADTGDFATAAQGTKADSATQPGDLAAVATSGAYGDLTGTPTLGTSAELDVDTSVTLSSNSDTKIASQKATKTYADTKIAKTPTSLTSPNLNTLLTSGLYRVSGTLTNGPAGVTFGMLEVFAAADYGIQILTKASGSATDTWVRAGSSFTTAPAWDSWRRIWHGGDFSLDTDTTLAANSDSNVATQKAVKAYVDANAGGGGSGDVVGPASSTDANIALFDGTTGKLLKDGGKGLPTGAIVGTSDTQTLTNKTIDAASNTISNIGSTNLSAALANTININTLDRIDPRDTAFGGVMGSSADKDDNGTAMDLAIQAALSDNLPLFIPPGAGFYLNASQITHSFDESDVRVYGEGEASKIVVADNEPLFQIDTTAAEKYRHEFRDFSVDFTATSYDQTSVIKVLANTSVAGGLRDSTIRNITMRGGDKLFDAQATKLVTSGGFDNTPGLYGFLKFQGIHIPQHTRYPSAVINFASGQGPHCMLVDSELRADATSGYCWKSGDGTAMLGDLIIAGNHLVLGSYGIRCQGPTNHSTYSRNCQFIGNQIDVMTDGIGWLSDLDSPFIVNTQLAGSTNGWKLDGSYNVDLRDVGAAEIRRGLFGKTAGNGTTNIWRVEKSFSQTIGSILVEVTADSQSHANARYSYAIMMLRWNGTTWNAASMVGPVSIASSDFVLVFTPNGDGLDIAVTLANTTSTGAINSQITAKGRNCKITQA